MEIRILHKTSPNTEIYIYIYMHLFFFSLKLQTDSLLSSLNKTKLADQSKQTKIMALSSFFKPESYTRPVQIQKYNIYIYMHLFSFSFNLKLWTDSLLSSLNKTKLADQSKQTKIMAFVFFFLTDKNEGCVFFFLVFFFKNRKVHEQQFAGFLIAQMYRALPSVMTG